MEIPKNFDRFNTQNGNTQFCTVFDINNWEFPFFFKQYLEFPYQGQNSSLGILKILT